MTETALAELLAARPVRAGPGGVDDRRGALRRSPVRGGAGHRHRRHQASAGAGGGLARRTPRWSPTCWSGCGSGAWTSPARSWSASTGQGAARRGARRARSPGDPSLPTAQDPKCRKIISPTTSQPRSAADASGLPRRLGAGGRGAAARPWPHELDRTHPGAAGQPARGPGRDPDRAAPGRAAHPGPHPALARTASSR